MQGEGKTSEGSTVGPGTTWAEVALVHFHVGFFFFFSKYSVTGSAVGCICGCGTTDMEEGGPTTGLEHPQVLVSAVVL